MDTNRKTHRTAVWLAVSAASGLALLWGLLGGKPFAPSVLPGRGGGAGGQTTDPEAWVENTAERGVGVVRTQVGNAASEHRVVMAGPLSDAGKNTLRSIIRRQRDDMEVKLKACYEASPGDNPVAEYRKELAIVLKIERARVIEQLFERGVYLTLKNGDLVPPRPSGTSLKQVGPLQLADGSSGWAVFFVDLEKHSETREYLDALRDATKFDRDEAIRRFHEKPYAERRAWVDRYMKLKASRDSEGVSSLGVLELRELLAMDKEIRYLRVRIHLASATLIALD